MADFSRARGWRRRLSTALDRSTGIGAWLVLPLALLLFAQWPLRDLVGAWSRQANDAAQWLFAIYVALALREATRRHVHMAAGRRIEGAAASPWRRALARRGEAACTLPWAAFVLVAASAPAWRSLLSLEAFPDTFNPLYFIVRLAAWLLALGLLLQALLDLSAPGEPSDAAATP